jgi:DNA-binding beta-propeller fold protein YncE
LLIGALWGVAWSDEFSDLCASLGTTTTLIGVHQTTTTNGDGTGINFWESRFEGAPASAAALSGPHIANADAFGNVYIADKFSHAILKITPDGLIHTFAGTHAAGFNGDGPAPANTLQLDRPNGLFVFPDGTVYLLDPGNRRIRRVGTDGMMTTVVINPVTEPGETAGTGFDWYASGRGLWVSPDRQLIYYTNEFAPVSPSIIADGATVKKWTPAGGIEVVCSKAVGFRNPGNIAVNPMDGKLYVTDRAEDDTTKAATGLFRIDGPDARTRITGDSSQPLAADGQLAINSFIEQPRGIAFLPNGAYFLCTHKAVAGTPTGDVWYVDTAGVLHLYIHGRGSKDYYNLTDGLYPPLTGVSPSGQEWFSQTRAVTIAPDGNLLVVSNDSGFVFRVNNLAPHLPSDLRPTHYGGDGLRLNWEGIFGRGYLVQRTSSLRPASWQTIGAAAGNAGGVLSEFVDPAATGQTTDFYRLAPAL